jgi:hypothetical protein
MTTRHLQQHWLIRLLCCLTVLPSVAVASADECEQTRLRATIDASEVLTQTAPQVFTVTLSGTGKGQHFGRLTFGATELIDFRQFSDPEVFQTPRTVVTDGQFTITAANGDTPYVST